MAKTTVQERYTPVPMTTNQILTLENGPQSAGGFLAITGGTLTIEARNEIDGDWGVVLNSFPVSAGIYIPLVMYLGCKGVRYTLGGGASGTLLL